MLDKNLPLVIQKVELVEVQSLTNSMHDDEKTAKFCSSYIGRNY